MFLVKYAISVKREEMRKLEKLAREEEHKLVIAEQDRLYFVPCSSQILTAKTLLKLSHIDQ